MNFHILIKDTIVNELKSEKLLNEFNNIREGVLPHYLTNDTAHQIDHADEVAFNAISIILDPQKIAQHLPDLLSIPTEKLLVMAIYAAYVHDMFCDERRSHHERAFGFVLYHSPTWMPVELIGDNAARKMVADAVREHRASWKFGYSSQFSELIACADRGCPVYDNYFHRSYQFAISKQNLTPKLATIHAVKHLQDKYGLDGYAKYPDLYTKLYERELFNLRQIIYKKYLDLLVRNEDLFEKLIQIDVRDVNGIHKAISDHGEDNIDFDPNPEFYATALARSGHAALTNRPC